MDTTPMRFTPMPVIDPDLDVNDRAAVLRAEKHFYDEQHIRFQEMCVLRDKLKWCYRREGANHLQNCRHLAMQYLDFLRSLEHGTFVGFQLPPQKRKVIDA